MNQQGAAGKLVTSRNIKIAFWLVTSLFFLWGFSYGLLDVMIKTSKIHLGITKPYPAYCKQLTSAVTS